MGFTKTGDPFVSTFHLHLYPEMFKCVRAQVGPVVDPASPDEKAYEGQYVAAGYSGHGMPRAFAWSVVFQSVTEILWSTLN